MSTARWLAILPFNVGHALGNMGAGANELMGRRNSMLFVKGDGDFMLPPEVRIIGASIGLSRRLGRRGSTTTVSSFVASRGAVRSPLRTALLNRYAAAFGDSIMIDAMLAISSASRHSA